MLKNVSLLPNKMLYLSLALGAPENRLRGIFPDPWNLMRIIPTEERGMNYILNIMTYIKAGPS